MVLFLKEKDQKNFQEMGDALTHLPSYYSCFSFSAAFLFDKEKKRQKKSFIAMHSGQ